METKYELICPCCNKPIQLQIEKSESGEIQFGLFHCVPEVPYVEIQAKGYEFGVEEGGESCV